MHEHLQGLLQMQVTWVHETICSGGVNGHRLTTRHDMQCTAVRAWYAVATWDCICKCSFTSYWTELTWTCRPSYSACTIHAASRHIDLLRTRSHSSRTAFCVRCERFHWSARTCLVQFIWRKRGLSLLIPAVYADGWQAVTITSFQLDDSVRQSGKHLHLEDLYLQSILFRSDENLL